MIITRTPLRISLFGGGTDFPDFYRMHQGAVLSFTIDKYIDIALKDRFDRDIVVQWGGGFQRVSEVDKVQHELVREAMKMTGIKEGVEIHTLADIPAEGTGLGSSSSVTVGILNVLYAYKGEQVPAQTLAEQACQIEIEILGKPIGVQDQYIAAYGGLRFLEFNSDGRVRVEALEIGENKHHLSNNFLLFFTGKTRKSSKILAEQKGNIASKVFVLKKMAKQAKKTRKLILQGHFNEIGLMLDKGWQLKKKMASGISNPEIDEMYKRAKRAGALGGKITGAGGGGFLLLYVPPNKQDNVRDALRDFREFSFYLERDGSKVIFNIRR